MDYVLSDTSLRGRSFQGILPPLQGTMRTTKPPSSKDEFAKRGDTIYEQDIHPHLPPEDEGKFVLIDIETGVYEIDEDGLAASDRLLARCPIPRIWMARAGLLAARRYQ